MAIYYPETIDSMYLPGIGDTAIGYEESISTTPSTSGGVNYAEQVPVNVRFPIKTVAVETMGSSFNTKTKKILGDFSFGVLGAITVGEYVYGESGEVKISPNGIIAKNVNGDTTFALDGTTGDATFKGTIQAGAFISGAVEVGSGNVQIDGANKRIIINDGTDDIILIGYQQGGF